MRALFALLPLAALAGCGEGEVARPARAAAAPAPHVPVPGPVGITPAPVSLDAVRGRDARTLVATFGEPRIDLQEGKARKLQFVGGTCVLDVYLYPRGRGEPIVTHLDTRLRDGRPVDPASCVATLRRVSAPSP